MGRHGQRPRALDGKHFVRVTEPGAPREGVTAMLEDRQGTLWFGTPGDGLVRYRNGVFDVLTRKDGLASNWIVALHEDRPARSGSAPMARA